MNEVCRFCPNDCYQAEPVTVEGVPIVDSNNIVECYRWTCGLSGMLAARHALKTGVPEPVLLYDGTPTQAIPFGSDDKPTGYEGEFMRYVTPHGDIIANNADQEFFYTGQNAFRRRK